MVFSSIVFLFYFLPLFLAAFLLSGFSKYALLLFSLVFYAWGEPVFLPLILLMIALNFWLGRAIERGQRPGAPQCVTDESRATTMSRYGRIVSLKTYADTNLVLLLAADAC